MKIKAVLFDMDGVLVDNDVFEDKNEKYIVKYLAEKKNIPYKKAYAHWVKYLEPLVHKKEWHDWRLISEQLGLGKIWIEAHMQNLKHLKMISGAEDLLKTLQKKYKLVIASDAIREVIDIKLGYFGLLKYFSDFFSQDDSLVIKNDEIYFKNILNKLNLKAGEVVLVDDRNRGIKTAGQLGIKTILVPYEYKVHRPTVFVLKTENIAADFRVKQLSQIPKILENL